MNPVFSALTIIGAASSKRPRDSSMLSLKAANSRRASPRPMPSRSLPLHSMSTTAAFSATRSGSCQGRMTAAVPRLMPGQTAAR